MDIVFTSNLSGTPKSSMQVRKTAWGVSVALTRASYARTSYHSQAHPFQDIDSGAPCTETEDLSFHGGDEKRDASTDNQTVDGDEQGIKAPCLVGNGLPANCCSQ